jgi:hypothetical protein
MLKAIQGQTLGPIAIMACFSPPISIGHTHLQGHSLHRNIHTFKSKHCNNGGDARLKKQLRVIAKGRHVEIGLHPSLNDHGSGHHDALGYHLPRG